MVQGFFFQERMVLGIGYKPIEGTVAVVNQALVRDMFAGLIWKDEPWGTWTNGLGSLDDAFGVSRLTCVEVTDSEFRFDKQYEDRSYNIHYEFHRDGDLWVGTYISEVVGEGAANCVLTPLPERMLEPVP